MNAGIARWISYDTGTGLSVGPSVDVVSCGAVRAKSTGVTIIQCDAHDRGVTGVRWGTGDVTRRTFCDSPSFLLVPLTFFANLSHSTLQTWSFWFSMLCTTLP